MCQAARDEAARAARDEAARDEAARDAAARAARDEAARGGAARGGAARAARAAAARAARGGAARAARDEDLPGSVPWNDAWWARNFPAGGNSNFPAAGNSNFPTGGNWNFPAGGNWNFPAGDDSDDELQRLRDEIMGQRRPDEYEQAPRIMQRRDDREDWMGMVREGWIRNDAFGRREWSRAMEESAFSPPLSSSSSTSSTPSSAAAFAPESNALEPNAPESNALEPNAPESNAPESNAPESNAPESNAPAPNAPEPSLPIVKRVWRSDPVPPADLRALLVCPITLAVFQDPVSAPSGITYEKEAVLEWLKKSETDPSTRAPLKPVQLVPNKLAIDLLRVLQQVTGSQATNECDFSECESSECDSSECDFSECE